MMWVFSNIWQPDKAIAAINEARRDLEQAHTRRTEEAGAESRGVDEEGAGDEVISSSTRLVRCWPARYRSDDGTSDASMPQAGKRPSLPKGPLPFLCCVRIERLHLRGARRADGAALPRPLQLTVHAPLILQNTLPISLRWAILVPRNELLQDRYPCLACEPFLFVSSSRPLPLPVASACEEKDDDAEAAADRAFSRRLTRTAARTWHLRLGANKRPLKATSKNEPFAQNGERKFRRRGFVFAPSSKQAPRSAKSGAEVPLAVEVRPMPI